ncbi:hypothetical protein [Alloscardovia sp. HMSC034E08]|uniref:hypothetical protein n=1 Tax=Alloscardovia sp. HMSC034E08 TaxID=1739413 RepID=UPI001AEF3A5B|nr:hypothetical protein [Alloscardovia sp. HMSC034E08]
MKIQKLKDNSGYEAAGLHDIPELLERLSNKTLQQLEDDGVFIFLPFIGDAEDVGKTDIVLSYDKSKKQYCTSNVMGCLGYKDERLTIVSSFGEDQDYFF